MGQGRSLPLASSWTGRPAIVGAFTIDTVGNGFCASAVYERQKRTIAQSLEFREISMLMGSLLFQAEVANWRAAPRREISAREDDILKIIPLDRFGTDPDYEA
jgi:hypothetical protein